LLVISVTVISGVTIGLFVYSIAQQHLSKALEKELQVAARGSLSLIDGKIREWQRALAILAGEKVFQPAEASNEVRTFRLRDFRNGVEAYSNVSYYDGDKVKRADSDALNLDDQLSWLDGTRASRLLEQIRVVNVPFMRGNVLEIAASVRDIDGGVVGFIVGRVPLERLEQILSESHYFVSSGLGLKTMVFTSKGELIFSTDVSEANDRETLSGYFVNKLTILRNAIDGVRVLVPGRVGRSLDVDPWVVSVLSETISFNRALIDMRNRIALTIAVTLLLLIGFVFWLTSKTFRPLSQLLQAIHQLGEGTVETETVHVSGEMGALSRALNEAASKRIQFEEKLQKANEDLNAFVYIVSHDLRAPLRAIDMIADWIREDCPDELGEVASKHLDTLKGRVARMKKYLDDLLEYSRIGRVEAKRERVELRMLIDDAIQLSGATSAFPVEFESQVECLETNRAPLLNVLLNLISNAAKHHDREAGKISIRCESDQHRVRFEVSDDGPGIAEEFHARVFQIFTTLQPRDKVEGSGMGLAFVKKTVENFGGKAWIESDGKRGTKICFTWALNKFSEFNEQEPQLV
jgi:signal transduction histidine kinase